MGAGLDGPKGIQIHSGKNHKVLNTEMLSLVQGGSEAQRVRNRLRVRRVPEHSVLSSSHVPVAGTRCSTRLTCLLTPVKPFSQSLSHTEQCDSLSSLVWRAGRGEEHGRIRKGWRFVARPLEVWLRLNAPTKCSKAARSSVAPLQVPAAKAHSSELFAK